MRTNTRSSDPFEIPSLEEIQEIDRQRLQAIQALEISNDSVKCQKCGIAIPLLRTSTSHGAIELMLCKNRSSALKITAYIKIYTLPGYNQCRSKRFTIGSAK